MLLSSILMPIRLNSSAGGLQGEMRLFWLIPLGVLQFGLLRAAQTESLHWLCYSRDPTLQNFGLALPLGKAWLLLKFCDEKFERLDGETMVAGLTVS